MHKKKVEVTVWWSVVGVIHYNFLNHDETIMKCTVCVYYENPSRPTTYIVDVKQTGILKSVLSAVGTYQSDIIFSNFSTTVCLHKKML